MLTSMEQAWFWIGLAGMVVGVVAFLFMGSSAREEHRHHYVSSLFIALIAGTSYLAMALGEGRVRVPEGRDLFFARYIDWSLTTPLLLLGLATLALFSKSREKPGFVAGLLGADVVMILTGLFAGLSGGAHKWIWYIVSCGAFLAVLALIWGPLRAESARQRADEHALWRRQAGILTVLWIAYPIVWLLGTEGFRLYSSGWETLLIAVLDVSAKVGYGFLLLSGLRALAPHSAPAGRVETTSGGRVRATELRDLPGAD